jgi:CheY-like chemotaxis protein
VTLTREDDCFVCVVADTGIGMSADFMPFAFDRFRQADQTFTRTHGGLGLGLAIVKHIVEKHGGEVSVASGGPEQGAAFSVRLPAAATRSAVASAEPCARAADVLEPDFAGQLILVVDDDPTTRELLTTMLEGHGARVRAVGSAAAALAELDTEVPALLLADIGMPQDDGLSMMRRLRQRSIAAGGNVPGVALSAYARSEDRRAALDAGFDDFLTKPTLPADIVRTIARWLGGRTGEAVGLRAEG